MSKHKIDINKTYKIPKDFRVVNYKSLFLVISPLTANWIVLNSQEELNVFHHFLNGESIKAVMNKCCFDTQEITNVVTQIEAKRFCTKKVKSSTDENKSLHLYLTNKCNLSCPHCYMYSGESNKNELTTDEILNLITDYKKIANGKRITLSGGEPCIHVDFDLIIKKSAELGLEVKILTNGTLLTNDRINSLVNCINAVQISIDGYSEESNASIRGKGHFSKALEAVDVLISNGVETSIAITPSLELLRNHSIDYINFAETLLTKYDGKKFEIKFAEGLTQGRTINPSVHSNEEYAALINKIQRAIYGDQFELFSFVETMKNNVILDNCMFGVFSVSSIGDVFFCPEIGSLKPIANIRTASFADIVAKSTIAEKATLISRLKPCCECELLYICGGGCRTRNFPELVKRSSFENFDYSTISPRRCTSSIKERFYDLMIKSNEYLYTPLRDN